jgi:4'-phosphopantetheinyl transferase
MTSMPHAAAPILPGECRVWWAGPAAGERLVALLGETERDRLARLRAPGAAGLYLAAHALARIVVAAHAGMPPEALVWDTTCRHCGAEHGKPRLLDTTGAGTPAGGLDFSLSHSGRRLAVAVASAIVGVDVEAVDRPGVASLARRVLAPAERPGYARVAASGADRALLVYWTRKEAVLKATGHGLAMPLSEIVVSAPDEPGYLLRRPSGLRDGVALADLDAGPAYVGCVATIGGPVAVEERDGGPLLRAAGGHASPGAGKSDIGRRHGVLER